MNAESEPGNTLLDQILAEDDRELRLLVAQGLFPLPPQDLLTVQVVLAGGDEPELAEAAQESLSRVEPKIAADVLAETADKSLLAYFGERHDHPVILEAILRNRDVSAAVLSQVAPRLSPELQEVLILRQDIIVEEPSVLDRLEENPALSSYVQRRIYEYREHLVRIEVEPPPSAPPVEEPVEPSGEEATDEEVEAALAEALETPAAGERDEVTGLSESQIRSLPVPVRLRLARGAPRSLRSILIKDKNSVVAVSVLHGNAMTESEVELIASNRSVAEEVLSTISRTRQWNRKYNIVHALIKNPRTPVGLAVRLTPRLAIRDLRNLSRDRNVSEAVRNTAARLYRIKAF